MAARDPIDEFCTFVTSHTTQQDVATKVVPYIKKLPKNSAALLVGALPGGRDPLQLMDPKTYSAGYIVILLARLSQPDVDLPYIWPLVSNFTITFDADQLRLVPDYVITLAATIRQLAFVAGEPSASIPLLRNLLRFSPSPDHLTSVHRHFVQQCLIVRDSVTPGQILLHDMSEVDSKFIVDYHDHLLYHYFGGVLLALAGNYARAIEFLEITVSAPGTTASAIQVDAYKKLVLIQLLHQGRTSQVPKYTSSAVSNAIRGPASAYNEFAQAFQRLEQGKVRNLVERHTELFLKDRNLGLIRLCLHNLRRRVVVKLTETYATIRLEEVARRIGSTAEPVSEEQTRELIEEMVRDRDLFATITESGGTSTVSFFDDPETYKSDGTLKELDQREQQLMGLGDQVREIDYQISRSKDFIQKALQAGGPGGGMGFVGMAEDLEVGPMGWDDDTRF